MGFEIKLNPVEEEDGGTRETQVIIIRENGGVTQIKRKDVDVDSKLLDKIPDAAVNDSDGMIDVSKISDEELLRDVLDEIGFPG